MGRHLFPSTNRFFGLGHDRQIEAGCFVLNNEEGFNEHPIRNHKNKEYGATKPVR